MGYAFEEIPSIAVFMRLLATSPIPCSISEWSQFVGAISDLAAASQWLTIETIPQFEKDEGCLGYDRDEGVVVMRFNYLEDAYTEFGSNHKLAPTHWMPIPPPPAVEVP